jgi:DNA-binding CsgD family transcriptional regulator
MSHRANPIDVIETAYDLQSDDAAWLAQLAAVMRPLLDGGHGVWAYYYDTELPATRWLDTVVMLGARRSEVQAAKRIATKNDLVERTHTIFEPLASALEAMRATDATDAMKAQYTSFLDEIGACDYFAFRTVESGGKGAVVAAAQRTPWSPDKRTRSLWARVASHVAAARRLRNAFGATRTPAAVLTPTGRVDHAEGTAISARERLREAVLAQERARGSLRRRDPFAATECWRALVSGEWSIVERFERNGRRYLLAHANPPDAKAVRGLSPRESTIVGLAASGKSNKLIAYELGLSDSAISSHLHAALRKLGISSRSELILLAGRLVGAPRKLR